MSSSISYFIVEAINIVEYDFVSSNDMVAM